MYENWRRIDKAFHIGNMERRDVTETISISAEQAGLERTIIDPFVRLK
jgi:hypothetical protein